MALKTVKSVATPRIEKSKTTDRCRRLTRPCLDTEDLFGEVSLRDVQRQPINVGGVRGRYASRLSCDGECVGFTPQASGSEIPLGTQARAGDGVGDEVVLAEDGGSTDEGEAFDNLLSRQSLGGLGPDVAGDVRGLVELRRAQA